MTTATQLTDPDGTSHATLRDAESPSIRSALPEAERIAPHHRPDPEEPPSSVTRGDAPTRHGR
ncbi:hypothetical protein [Halegenticoccus tardaugens]|uniref:hypothetical protein n=1 Tax=Halegenticoccus tardaugens TaxID=2071624 RepID=UPI00100A8297|nr:hypothetical protein [Halegenticoccus tardaugens]